ncbi:MAG TPA: hypothetical protein PLP19_02010 [bacterium]|nr:hypothetical protein [bacterium]HPN42242.1 hypothetical protein [bacterium]
MISAKTLKSFALCLGIAAITLQIILMREFFAVFYGNELCIGILLAVWLVWVAAGSWAGVYLGRFRFFRRPHLFPVLQTASLAAAIGAVIMIRLVRVLLAVPQAEYISFVELSGFSIIVFAAPCLLVGLQFAHLVGAMRPEGDTAHDHGSMIYIYEALGSAIGGLAVSLAALRFFSNIRVLLLLGALSAGFFVCHRIKWYLAPALLFVLLLALPQIRYTESFLLQKYWHSFNKDMRLVDWRQSRFSELSVIEWGGEKTLYSNSVKQTQLPDPLGAQELAALTLVQHPRPENILLLGGGLGGAAPELARNKKSHVIYVELDRDAYNLAQAHYDSVWQASFKQGNLRLEFTDGRAYLGSSTRLFDMIIINIGKPANAAANRYYTDEFFRLVRSKLSPGGVLAICGYPAAENYFGPELLQLNTGLYALLRPHFTDVLALPGDNAWYFAATDTVTLTRSPEEMSARFVQQGLSFDYFYPQMYWQYTLPERLARLDTLLAQTPALRLNRDFSPVAYFYDFVLWNKLVRGQSGFFTALAAIKFRYVVISTVIITFLAAILSAGKKRGVTRGGVLTLTVFIGLAGITVNIILVLAFQVIFGYIYEWLGIVVGLYMAGLALAALLMYDLCQKNEPVRLLLLILVLAIVLLLILVPALFMIQAKQALFVYMLLTIVAGAITGGAFPLLSIIYKRLTGRISAGKIYAADLAGSACGSCLVSGFFIPLYGFYNSLFCIAVIGLILLACWLDASRAHIPRRD